MKYLEILMPLVYILNCVVALRDNPCDLLPPPGTGFVNDPRSCPAYFSCISFLPFEKMCSSPLFFNERDGTCDSPANVDCNQCQPSGIHSIGDPTSCTRWILCVNGIALSQECAPGTAFDDRIGTCNLEEEVTCGANTCSKLQGGVGIAPSPVSCKSFNFCYNGLKVGKGSCAPGLLFDTKTNRCVRVGANCFSRT